MKTITTIITTIKEVEEMKKHNFDKLGLEEMYNDTTEEVYNAIDNGTLDNVKFEVRLGKQVVEIPNSADCFEIIFAALEECLKTEEEDKDGYYVILQLLTTNKTYNRI